MRIAQVVPGCVPVPPRGYGGTELVVSSLVDGLVKRGQDVTLFATGDSSTSARLEYVFETAPGPASHDSIWHDTVHQLMAHRDAGRFDLIHQHANWSGLLAALLSDRPVVHTLHGPFTDDMRLLYGLIADRAWFVAISEAQRSLMPELRYAGVIHHGIDPLRYLFQPKKEDFLLFVGRAVPEKGAGRAVEVAVRTGLPLVMVVKMEEAAERRYWNRVVEPMLPASVRVLQNVTHEEKADLMAGARAVLFPADWDEPFGLVMVEAMASGTPVIGTPRGSVPEVIEDGVTGYIVPVEDYTDAAAEALGRVDEIDPAACRERVEKRFSEDRMVDDYLAVYEGVIAGVDDSPGGGGRTLMNS